MIATAVVSDVPFAVGFRRGLLGAVATFAATLAVTAFLRPGRAGSRGGGGGSEAAKSSGGPTGDR